MQARWFGPPRRSSTSTVCPTKHVFLPRHSSSCCGYRSYSTVFLVSCSVSLQVKIVRVVWHAQPLERKKNNMATISVSIPLHVANPFPVPFQKRQTTPEFPRAPPPLRAPSFLVRAPLPPTQMRISKQQQQHSAAIRPSIRPVPEP